MSPKSTVILFGLLAALCLGYWGMLRLEERGKQQAADALRVFSFEPEDLATLDVARLGEAPVTARRDADGAWVITAPHESIDPNQIVWQRVAKALAGLMNARTIPDGEKNLPTYGLDEPALTIAATTTDGKPVRLAFGLEDPTQLHRYARMLEGGPDEVFLVDAKTFFELDRSLLDLRNRYLVSVGDKGITRIEFALFWKGTDKGKAAAEAKGLKIGDESVAVVTERGDDGAWRMVEPMEGPANAEILDGLAKEVQFAVGQKYIDAPESLADYGLDPPTARITIASGDGPRQTLLFGALDKADEKGGLFAKRAEKPAVFVMDSAIIGMFPRSVDAFRERRLLTRRANEIQQIHYRAGDTDVVLKNDPEKGWSMVQPEVDDVDQIAVSRFISMLKALTGVDFPKEPEEGGRAAFGLDAPRVSVALTFTDEAPAEILIGAALQGGESYYVTQDTGSVLTLPVAQAEGMMWALYDFRSRLLMRFEGATALRASLYFDGVNYGFERVHGKWLVRQPANYLIENASDMDALIKAVNPARAAAVEATAIPEDLAPYGLDKPLCVIAFTCLSANPMTQQVGEVTYGPLSIGNVTEDDSRQRFATMKGHPELFRVSQDIVDEIRGALRGIHAQ